MTFRPMPKPEKRDKKKPKPIKAKGSQRYRTSSGELLTQSQIDSRLHKVYSGGNIDKVACECCHKRRAEHHDHTISQRQCKLLKITEFTWYSLNWSLSCPICHHEWESYKSGKFTKHMNFIERMLFMKEYDPEGFNKRMNYVIDLEQIKQLT